MTAAVLGLVLAVAIGVALLAWEERRQRRLTFGQRHPDETSRLPLLGQALNPKEPRQ